MSEQLKPPRPTIPVTFYCLMSVLAAESAFLGAVPMTFAAHPIRATAVFALVAVLIAWLFHGGRLGSGISLLALSLVAGLWVSDAFVGNGAAFQDAAGKIAVSSWHLEAVTDSSESSYGWRCRARVFADRLPSCDVWLTTDEPLDYGSVVTVVGRYTPNTDNEWGRISLRQGVWGTVKAVRITSVSESPGIRGLAITLRESTLKLLHQDSSDGRSLLAGSVCGYRRDMDTSGLSDLFATCGVSHLVAVSGGHIAIIASLVAIAADRLRMRPAWRALATLALSGLFVICCGMPVSAVRSWLMSSVAAASGLAGRRPYALSSVCLVSLGLALLDPGVSGQLGFLLSVASVLAICIAVPYVAYALDAAVPPIDLPRTAPGRVRARLSECRHGLLGALATTLVAQAATLPLTASAFSQLSLVAPLANIVLSLPFTALVSLGSVCAALPFAPHAQAVLLAICDLIGAFTVAALRTMARMPFASVPVEADALPAALVAAAGFTVLLVWWPDANARLVRRGLAAGALVCTLVVGRSLLWAPARIVVLDVGQGDAILVQDGRSAILVDTGPPGAVVPALAREHVAHLDAVILTHLHEDHIGGVDDIAGALTCDEVVVGEGVGEALASAADGSAEAELEKTIEGMTGGPPVEIGYGDTLRVGGFTLRMVWPQGPTDGSDNPCSVELAVEYDSGGRSLAALLTGDAEEDQTGEAIAAGDVGDIDFLKVGHHGSEISITPAEAAALDPEVSVASAGEGNDYGHPDPVCVETLENVGSEFLCTIQHGDVTIEPGVRGPVVSTAR